MSIIIGSARIGGNGKATGDAAGDQRQTSTPDYKGEVSMQEFYVHKKGWYVFRAKKTSYRKKIAKAMKTACNNKNIGYDQNGRYGIVKYGTASKVKTECDCSSLVRECIKEATGKDLGDMTTSTMPRILEESGLFEDKKAYVSGTNLLTGDILVTKVKGHTAVVVSGANNISKVAQPVLRKGSKGLEVGKLQKNLNSLGYKDENKNKLEVDEDFGSHTEAALIRFQKSAKTLEPDGVYGVKSWQVMEGIIDG
jgi:hypothetical protein